MAGLVALIMNLYMYMQRWYVIIFLRIWPTSDPNISMRRSLYCHNTFSMCKLIPITQITSKISLNILPSFLHNKNGIRLGATIFKINCSWYTRRFSYIDCKLNMDGSMNCCVSFISMHNIVYYHSNMTCLTVLIRIVHSIPKRATLYISYKLANFRPVSVD